MTSAFISDLQNRIKNNYSFTTHRGLALNAIGGFGLGVAFCSGLFLFFIGFVSNNYSILSSSLILFSLYIIFSSLFYFMEYIWHAIFHPETLDLTAYIVYTHSKHFHIALLLSFIEFIIEIYCFPSWKSLNIVTFIGLLCVIGGQILRTIAQYTAGINFTHLISTEKQKQHQLITDGIYKYMRHPSYCGWFYWSIGTQMLLFNPICILGFAAASWQFFNSRIPFEERYLVKFFGNDYIKYAKKTPTGVPFLKGYAETISLTEPKIE